MRLVLSIVFIALSFAFQSFEIFAKPVETVKLFRAIEEALADAGFEEESPLVALSD